MSVRIGWLWGEGLQIQVLGLRDCRFRYILAWGAKPPEKILDLQAVGGEGLQILVRVWR